MYQDRVINNSRTNCRSRKRKKLFPSCQLVFDCLQDNVCTPFKGYFTKIEHNINTRNNGCSLKLPKAKLEFGRRSFAFQGARKEIGRFGIGSMPVRWDAKNNPWDNGIARNFGSGLRD